MDQHEAALNTSFFSNTTRSTFYCPHEPQLVWDFIQDTTFPWVFCRGHIYNSPTAVLLNTCNHSSNSNILLSTMAVTDLLVGGLCVPLSAVVGLLVSYQILTDYYICVLDFIAISSAVILTICSIFHLTVMAWERYVAIGKRIDYKVMVTKSLIKYVAIIAWVSATDNCMSTTLKYFSIIMGENLWRFSSLSLVLALGLVIDFFVMMYLSHVSTSSQTPSNLLSQRVNERKTRTQSS